MAQTGTKLVSGLKKITAAGTRERLLTSGAYTSALSVLVQALYTNEGRIVIGGENVVAKEGSHATPEQVGVGLEKGAYASFDINDAAEIWVDTTKTGDGVSYTVLLG